MKLTFSLPSGLAVICLVTISQAHTWLEDLRLIGSNGSFVGDAGYPRAFVDRNSGIDPNAALVYRLGPDTNKDTKICRSEQTVGNQTPGFPALKAGPSDNIAMRYLENGHVTKLEPGRPARGGMVFVYGTKEPSDKDTLFAIHRVWNAAGTGGDKRGRLIATRPYDDGQCYQVSSEALSVERQKEFPKSDPNADLKCQTDIQIPADAGTSGDYALYWVWEWPLLNSNGEIQTAETYTACADIELTAQTNTKSSAGAFIAAQDINNVAIKEQLENQFILDPSAQPAITTAPPYSMAPTGAPSSATPVSSPSKQPTSAPSPSSDPVKPSSSAPPKASTTLPPAQGFVTVTVTATPDSQGDQKTVTVTDYIIVKPDATTIAKGTVTGTATLTPLPADSFIGSRTSSASASPSTTTAAASKVVPTSIAATGPPSSIRPFLPGTGAAISQSPSATPSTTKPGGVFKQTSSTFTTSDAVVPLPTAAPLNGTAPITGRYLRKSGGRWSRL